MKFLPAALDRLATFGCRHSRAIVAGGIGFILLAPFMLIGLEVDADASKVIPYEDPVGLAYRESRRLFGDSNLLVIEIRHDAVAPPELNELTDRLAAELAGWDDIEYVEARPLSLDDRRETAGQLRAALANGGPEVFADFLSRFTEKGMRRQLLRSRKRLIAMDDPQARALIAEDLLGVRDVLAEFQKPRVGWRERYTMSPYFDAPDGGSRLVLVQPGGSADDNGYCRSLLARIDELMSRLTAGLSEPDRVEHRVSGVHAMTGEATEVLFTDLGTITLAATSALFVLLWLAFGGLRATVICFLPLVVAQLGVLVIARVFFNPINFMTVGFAAVVVGLGLDVGLHLTGRFAQFCGQYPAEDAIRRTLGDCGPPVVIGSLSTTVAFLSLLVTDNRGLEQFGILTSVGLFLTLVVTLVLFPALAHLLASKPGAQSMFTLRGAPRGLFAFVTRRPGAAFGLACLIIVVSLPFASRFEFSRNVLQFFPDDMKSLDAADEVASAHGHTLGATTQVMVRAPDLAQAMAIQQNVDARLEAMVAAKSVTRFQSPSSYLLYEEDFDWMNGAAMVRAARARFFDQLTALRFRDADEYRDYYDMVGLAVDPEYALTGTPRLAKFVHESSDGVILQTQVAVAPADGGLRAFDAEGRRALSEELRAVAFEGPGEIQVSGLVQVYDRSNERLLADFGNVSWIAVVLVGVVVMIFFRRALPAALTFLPLAGALPLTLGLIHLFDVPIMPSAIGFGAIILGVGIDDGVHILARVHGGKVEDMPRVLEEIGTVITLTTASTIIGFGSLALSSLTVMSSLGIIIAVGVAACWFFSLFLLPAAVRLVARKPGATTALGVMLVVLAWPQAGEAQTRSASELMDGMAETLDSVEAVACNIKQVKRLKQLDGAITLEGPLLFQKPHFIKLELSGDENLSMFCDGESVWLVDRDLEEVDTFDLSSADRDRQLSRMLPPLFFLTREELEERFDITSVAPAAGDGKHGLAMVPKTEGEFPFERLSVYMGGATRVQRMTMEFSNGDRVETDLEGCRKRPRTSLAVFKYRGATP